jgi:anionic cell wall polymer biosynthesis LytR-Cps2A-Psr (LCP) family protein
MNKKNKHIKASSLAEVVIALAIISLCIGVASLVFVRSTKVTVNFQEVKKQTEIQSLLWRRFFNQDDKAEIELEGIQQEEDADDANDSLIVISFKGLDEKIIWQQQWMNHE